jgi:hypothetical protein
MSSSNFIFFGWSQPTTAIKAGIGWWNALREVKTACQQMRDRVLSCIFCRTLPKPAYYMWSMCQVRMNGKPRLLCRDDVSHTNVSPNENFCTLRPIYFLSLN